ncbi:MAG: 4-phosphoerythronate dehydrogenase [Muribaculaceae bacterium]|nr:4-phosphoerythronate dehydrogenase [Muribaculaceae bacterium]
MKIVIDKHIPYIAGVVEPVADVVYAAAADIDVPLVKDARALIVRTRTRCDATLLDGSSVELICTAAIGTDHIDLDYCRAHGIAVANAPGCNAPAVAQWTLATIARWLDKRHLSPTSLTLGVVGVGHVGSIVARWAQRAGMSVLRNDPPRAEREDETDFCALNELLEKSDIITFHTPLTREGKHRTFHLCDSDFLASATRCRLLINAARGGILDERALDSWNGDLALDCWENEPRINSDLLQRCFVATPHIAGYSLEGKQRATAAAVRALEHHFGWNLRLPFVPPGTDDDGLTLADIAASYDPFLDTEALRRDGGASFEALRNRYTLRHEPQFKQ